MKTASQAEFANILGTDASYITRLKQAGRIVMVGNRVDVEKSLALIEQTEGTRDDVADRHAQGRRAKSGTNGTLNLDGMDGSRRIKAAAEARRITALADQEEMERDRMAGDLIAKEDVDSAMKFIGATVRALLEVFPDQTAPLVAPISNLDECHALLTTACTQVLLDLGAAIERQKSKLEKDVSAVNSGAGHGH